MSVVYLSGPISLGGTSTPDEISAFSSVFLRWEGRLVSLGHDVINPCACKPQVTWEDYMRLGITAVCRADVVAVLPRWLESQGAVLEVYVARRLAIPVIAVEDVADYLAQRGTGRA